VNLLTETQVAERYGVTKPCLRRWRVEGRALPFVKIGRCVRYRPEDVEAFILQNVRRPQTKAQGVQDREVDRLPWE
jgi:excisionase family DNA binding protein